MVLVMAIVMMSTMIAMINKKMKRRRMMMMMMMMMMTTAYNDRLQHFIVEDLWEDLMMRLLTCRVYA